MHNDNFFCKPGHCIDYSFPDSSIWYRRDESQSKLMQRTLLLKDQWKFVHQFCSKIVLVFNLFSMITQRKMAGFTRQYKLHTANRYNFKQVYCKCIVRCVLRTPPLNFVLFDLNKRDTQSGNHKHSFQISDNDFCFLICITIAGKICNDEHVKKNVFNLQNSGIKEQILLFLDIC